MIIVIKIFILPDIKAFHFSTHKRCFFHLKFIADDLEDKLGHLLFCAITVSLKSLVFCAFCCNFLNMCAFMTDGMVMNRV